MNSVKTIATTAAFVLVLSGTAFAQNTRSGIVKSSGGVVDTVPSAVNRVPSAVNRAPSAVESAPSAVESSGTGSGFSSRSSNAGQSGYVDESSKR